MARTHTQTASPPFAVLQEARVGKIAINVAERNIMLGGLEFLFVDKQLYYVK